MRLRRLLLCAPIIVAASLTAQPRRGEPIALVGVNVIPMDSSRVLIDQTVLVRDGKISAIGPRSRVQTTGARRYELPGYYLRWTTCDAYGNQPA